MQAKRNTPVDVQLGGQLWEDAPQELRSRLWTALLEHPELVGTVSEELVSWLAFCILNQCECILHVSEA